MYYKQGYIKSYPLDYRGDYIMFEETVLESKNAWDENADFLDERKGDNSNHFHCYIVRQGFLLNKEVLLVGSTYWNMVYGKDIGNVLKDEESMKNMENLGENMAWLIKKIKSIVDHIIDG